MAAARGSLALFGDDLARARESWVREMALRLSRRGLGDYRRSDALVLRVLLRGPLALSDLTATLGVSRQLARKVANGLVERDLASVDVDASDARRRIVTLNDAGRTYATSVIDVLHELNDELDSTIEPERLSAAREVLTFVIAHFGL